MSDQITGHRLSPQQRRVGVLQRDGRTYRSQCAVTLTGSLDAAALKESLGRLVNDHEILRTTFLPRPGVKSLMQVINPGSDFSWREVDLGARDAREREELLDQLFAEEGMYAHDLRQQTPLRASLVTLSATDNVLMLSLPALCADAGTLKNLVRQLARYYAATRAGEEAAAEVMQYADLSEWQNELLEGEESEAGRQFWRADGVATTPGLSLPFERAAGDAAFDPARLSVPLGESSAAAVERLARDYEASVSEVLLAGWQVLLSRVSGQPEIMVGVAFDGRKYEELEDAFGLFVRYLPVRLSLGEGARFADVLKMVGAAARGAGESQEYFDWDEYLKARGLGAADELAAAAFECDDAPPDEQQCGGLTFAVTRRYSCVERFKLKLVCAREAGGRLTVELHFDASRCEAEAVRRIGDEYATLIGSAAERPEAAVDELKILGEAERRRVLEEWNDTARDYPSRLCAHQLFEAQARRTPEDTALVFKDRRLTYEELDRRANQLARHLRGLGVGPDTLVGLCAERSVEMVVAVLGVMKAGGAYLPLDASHPKERLAYMLEDAAVGVLLTQERLIESLPAHTARLVRLDSDWELIGRESAEELACAAAPDNLAYVIYTSGSTGRPKGVMIQHRGLVNYLSWCAGAYAAAEGEGSPVHSPLGFDLTVTSLFSPLVSGRRVVLLPESPGLDELGSALRSGGDFSLVKITPAHLEALAAQFSGADAAGLARTLVIGGEALRWETLAFWREHAPATRLVNEYGPTETVVGCCVYEATAADPETGAVPIGHAIANTRLYVLDRHFNPVPFGAAGELCIGGDGLARGYLNRPELTAEKFIPHPFASEPGARLYRTGDQARHLADGRLEFLGRKDHQVKVRGFRIELGEVEAALAAHDAVRECVAVAREDTPGEKRLVAYVVAHENANTSVSDLRERLRERLPDYMIPATFVMLDALPLTPNGKVDRKALPAPEGAYDGLRESFVAPRDTLELQLMELWEEILDLKRVGVTENFFDLGGNSLSAVRLMAQIYKLFGKEMPLATLFANGTIEKFASLLRLEKDGVLWSPVVEIQPHGTKRPIFFIHPSGGGVLGYIHLARKLGLDQPFYGMQSPGLYGEITFGSVEEMATYYIEAMRGVQPEGPYQLGGWSLGGLIAFEMAQQLRARGETVPLLALLDTKSPIFRGDREQGDQAEMLAELAAALTRFYGKTVLSLHDELRDIAAEDQLEFLLEEMKKAHVVSPGTGLMHMRRFVEVYTTNTTAAMNYQPQFYPERVTLFRASEIRPEMFKENPKVWGDPALGWGEFAADIEIIKVPGLHEELIFDPSVQAVADGLAARARACAAAELAAATT